ncbi:MAG: 23S rRNA (uracil(1939)-C(5))-methyltransferase RlmD [Oscillospiraceae bacterium]|nr:23S rRNA (uracil(1939)-C(5))-methyltransferase RlmD [Oscillospiraceae bacterium]
MIIKKNEIYKIKIIDLSSDGQGIGKIENFIVFTEKTIPGDFVEIKILKTNKTYGYGKLIKIISQSSDRIKSKCDIADKCGGCSLQYMNYNAQLNHKKKIVANCLERIGKFKNINNIITKIIGMDNPYNYRNKAQFPVKEKALQIHKNPVCSVDNPVDSVDIGFFSKRSHDIINLDNCNISNEINIAIINIFKIFINQNINDFSPYNEINHTGLIRHIFTRIGFYTGEIMVCIVINGDNFFECKELIDKLSQIKGMTSIMLNINKNKTNVILGDKNKILWGKDYITDYLCGKKFKISVNSFYQINPIQTEKLYNKIIEFANIDKTAICIDAYCGIGTISIILSPYIKKVYSIEIINQAVNDAKENAKLNNIKNAEFITGKSEEIIPELINNGENIDLLIVDPPRKGCDIKLIESIIKSKIKKLIYISCDPATLARDLNLLCETTYELKKVQPIDMFPHTMHVETVVLLHCKNF